MNKKKLWTGVLAVVLVIALAFTLIHVLGGKNNPDPGKDDPTEDDGNDFSPITIEGDDGNIEIIIPDGQGSGGL